MGFEVERFTPPRTWNWALIAPAGKSLPGAARSAPAFSADLDSLRRALRQAAAAEPKTVLLAEEGGCLRFRARSRLFGFPDHIDVQLLEPEPGRVSLAIFSRARYGLYDFGVNRRRARRWLRAVEAALDHALER